MRVYLPLTLFSLAAALEGAALAQGHGFAVTTSLREAFAGDEEELEYQASRAAAEASLALVRAEGAPLRRVVLALEVPEARVRPITGSDVAAVELTGPVPWTDVASALVDDVGVEVEGIEDVELGWYATQELAALVQHA